MRAKKRHYLCNGLLPKENERKSENRRKKEEPAFRKNAGKMEKNIAALAPFDFELAVLGVLWNRVDHYKRMELYSFCPWLAVSK